MERMDIIGRFGVECDTGMASRFRTQRGAGWALPNRSVHRAGGVGTPAAPRRSLEGPETAPSRRKL